VLYAGLAPLQPSYLETAQDLGAGRLQRWRRVVLPLVAAPAVSSFLFVFVLSAADYVTPQLLGGTNGVMLGVQVQVAFIGTGDFAYGAAIAFAMLAGFLVCYALITLGLRLTKLDKIRFAA
jgi:spermidine/putrescine transport system permease protein